jgi:glycolate oxidase FAD binding subunit
VAVAKLIEIDGVAVEREELPASLEELSETMRRASAAGATMIPVGGGTKLHLGNPPRSARVALHTRGLCGVVEYEPDNMTVSVRAGTPLEEIQSTLARARQFLPIDPPHPARATAGGIAAANASGPLRFRYGTLRDMLIGVRVCHADGTVTKAGGKLVKNVTGYDMCKLYTGSLGTLGVLAELTFKVQPMSESTATVALAYPDLGSALEASQHFLRCGLLPDAIEAYNARACRGLERIERPPGGWLLLLRFGEVVAAVRWQIERVEESVPSTQGCITAVLHDGEAQSFWQRAASLRDDDEDSGEVRVKCSVLHQSAAAMATRIEEAGRRLGTEPEIFCHAGNHVLYARYRWGGGTAPEPAELRAAVEELRRQAALGGGHVVVEKAPAAVKRGLDAWGYGATALELMRRIKREFDPKDLLNPGRFVGGI